MSFRKTVKNLIREVKRQNYMNLINESGFSRVRQMMMGMAPAIDTLGIMTAENPGGVQADDKENKKLNKQFAGDLAFYGLRLYPY